MRALLSVYDKTGIALTAVKNHMAYARLAKHVRRLGVRRFSDYLAMLRSEEGAHEWEHFINALTTNLTSFFREAHHFDMLRQHAQRQRDYCPPTAQAGTCRRVREDGVCCHVVYLGVQAYFD